MPSIGGLELLLLAILAILVIGPKDLPRMMRRMGQWAARARSMADEFRRSFDDLAREQELAELRRQVNDLKSANPVRQLKDEVSNTIHSISEEDRENRPLKDEPRDEPVGEPGAAVGADKPTREGEASPVDEEETAAAVKAPPAP